MTSVFLQDMENFCRDYWARFERFANQLTRSCDEVFIVSGPLYLPHKADGGFEMRHSMLGKPPAIILCGDDAQQPEQLTPAIAVEGPLSNRIQMQDMAVCALISMSPGRQIYLGNGHLHADSQLGPLKGFLSGEMCPLRFP